MLDDNAQAVEYHFDEEHRIHVFVFHDNTRTTADVYMQIGDQAIADWIDAGYVNEPFCMLMDISEAGLFPMRYTVNRSISLLDKYERLPDRYLAYLTDSAKDRSFLEQLSETPEESWTNTRRVFSSAQVEAAKAWLVSCQAQ